MVTGIGRSQSAAGALLVDHLGALLALTLEGDVTQSPAETSGTAALIDRICRALARTLCRARPHRSVDCHATAILERTLHRGLASASVTFSGLLADCRMSMACKMLAEPRFDRVSIGGIGQKVGLTDPSHFIRQCRKYRG